MLPRGAPAGELEIIDTGNSRGGGDARALLFSVLDSLRSRFLLAAGLAVAAALLITALFSGVTRRAEKRGIDAEAIWKSRTGVDLAALPRLYPAHADSEEARALDVLLQPIDLHLGAPSADRNPSGARRSDGRAMRDLRDTLRAAIRSTTTEPVALLPSVVSSIERSAGTLDAVADYVATHHDIHWLEDHGPRANRSALAVDDHLTLHRLLVGRAFLALSRGDTTTAVRMLRTSQQLNRPLEERRELLSQFAAVGVERLQLALLRRGGSALAVVPGESTDRIRERYLAAMSSEAVRLLTNARQGAFATDVNDPPERLFLLIAGPKIELLASEAVTQSAIDVAEIRGALDGCAELGRDRRARRGVHSHGFESLNAAEAWRRFVLLELDRAITAAVLTGRASSPCPSVVLTVREEGANRIVEAKGLPPESDSVIGVPSVVTSRR
ncbi:MAG: hypothetical protein ABI837_01230 [Acidobacteriota bacterium]